MDLSILFVVLAGILIIFLIGYSIWSSNQEKSKMFENDFSNRPAQPINLQQEPTDLKPKIDFTQPTTEPIRNDVDSSVERSLSNIKIKLNDQSYKDEKPNIDDIQPSLFTNQEIEEETEIELIQESNLESDENNNKEEQIITLYLVAPENQSFNGLDIVQKLEEIGLQYGEHQIFHRHIDNAASPVIFSAANMMQPGVFDLDNIESLETVGLVFFMYIPSLGNDVANLKLMISTVESLSKSLGGFVLNDQRTLFDEQSHLEYIQRVQ